MDRNLRLTDTRKRTKLQNLSTWNCQFAVPSYGARGSIPYFNGSILMGNWNLILVNARCKCYHSHHLLVHKPESVNLEHLPNFNKILPKQLKYTPHKKTWGRKWLRSVPTFYKTVIKTFASKTHKRNILKVSGLPQHPIQFGSNKNTKRSRDQRH